MAMDAEFDKQSRAHGAEPRYKKRVGIVTKSLNVDVEVQAFVDLGAMARAGRISKSKMIDLLIQKEVRRRQRKMETSDFVGDVDSCA